MGNSSQNGPKMQKRQVFCHASQTCIECHGLVNQSETPKLWAIAHENGRKLQKRVFWHPSPKCTDCHIPCKSPRNPKTVAIAYENGPKMQK
jgi:hypothetical protein